MSASHLFGDQTIVDALAGTGEFAHTFGGEPDRDDARPDCTHGIRLHLLYRFDLTDPLVPIAVPGLKWLPLYYVFDFRANEVGYTLHSDASMTTYFPTDDENVSSDESWPSDDFPMVFPSHSIELAAHSFDPKNLDDAAQWAGVFGIRHLADDQLAELKRLIDAHCDEIGDYPPEGDDFYDYLCSPLWQGTPNNCCINPGCENNSKPQSLNVLALVPHDPIPGLEIWGGAYVQTIFEICPLCYTIRSSNQCG